MKVFVVTDVFGNTVYADTPECRQVIAEKYISAEQSEMSIERILELLDTSLWGVKLRVTVCEVVGID